jgi:regulator of extracellular matrix RemA (YlzA/DUF370 family)
MLRDVMIERVKGGFGRRGCPVGFGSIIAAANIVDIALISSSTAPFSRVGSQESNRMAAAFLQSSSALKSA